MDAYKAHLKGDGQPDSRYLGMDFPIPLNMAGMAEAMSVSGQKIEDPATLGPAMQKALESGKPAVLDVVIDGAV